MNRQAPSIFHIRLVVVAETLGIRSAQFRASVAVDRPRHPHASGRQGLGVKVIDQLVQDLRRDFPNMTDPSPQHLTYRRAFAEAFPDIEIVQQRVARLPRGRVTKLVEGLKRYHSPCLNPCAPNTPRWRSSPPSSR